MSYRPGTFCKRVGKGIIYVSGNIYAFTFNVLLPRAISDMEKHCRTRKLFLVIHLPQRTPQGVTGGGDVVFADRMALYLTEYCQEKKLRLITVIYEQAFSAGSFLSQIGQERWITAQSTIKFDRAGLHFPEEERLRLPLLKKYEAVLRGADQMQMSYLTSHGAEERRIRPLFNVEMTIGAEGAKRLHLVDRIIPEPKDLPHLFAFLARRQRR